LVIVDDHPMYRAGIRAFLSQVPEYDVVGEAGTARECFGLLARALPDMVLMDLVLPDMDGVVATREILRRAPEVLVVVLSGHQGARDVADALAAGARGYVLKGDPAETLRDGLGAVARGGEYVAPTLRQRLREFRAPLPGGDALETLSQREREIFRLAADCHTAPEIARNLCVARRTVETHLNRIHRKLGLRDRAELVRLAVHVGLVHSVR